MNKLRKTGFVEIRRGEERPFGLDEAAQYPLFTPDLIALMRSRHPAGAAHDSGPHNDHIGPETAWVKGNSQLIGRGGRTTRSRSRDQGASSLRG